MTKRNAAHFQAIRKELAEELGYDPDNLSTLESMRVDVVFGLKSALDEMRARMFEGQKVDPNEMRQIADTLERFLPRHTQPDPVPATYKRDPREVLIELADRWREADEADRAEKGLSPRVHDEEAQQRRIDDLEAELVRLRGAQPHALPAPEAEQRVINPPTGDIVGPCEQSDNPRNARPPSGPDDPRPPVTIEGRVQGSWRGPQDGPPPWLQKPKPVEKRVDGGPPVAKSGAETEAQRQRVNANRSIEYRVMGGGRPAEPWRGHAGGVDESFFWGGSTGKRAW